MRLDEPSVRAMVDSSWLHMLTAHDHGAERCRHVLVVPAYMEDPGTLDALLGSITDQSVHVIVVVNEPPFISADVLDRNGKLTHHLAECPTDTRIARITVIRVLVDAARGVGGARMIGCDIARRLQDDDEIESLWIHQTDADSMLPAGFFEQTEAVFTPHSALAVHGIKHHGGTPEALQAASVLRASFHLSVLYQQRARSPWAILSTGCGLSASAGAYDLAREWLPYSLAEDVWFGTLLGRAGTVHRMPRLRVSTQCRTESRCLSRPGETMDASGHSECILRARDRMAQPRTGSGFKMSPRVVWDSLAVAIRAMSEIAVGTCLEDGLRGAVDAATRTLGLGGAAPYEFREAVFDAIRATAGPIEFIEFEGSRAERYMALWRMFTRELQREFMLYLSQRYYPHEDFVGVIDESPFGVVHDGDWLQTAEHLAQIEAELCSTDVGITMVPEEP